MRTAFYLLLIMLSIFACSKKEKENEQQNPQPATASEPEPERIEVQHILIAFQGACPGKILHARKAKQEIWPKKF